MNHLWRLVKPVFSTSIVPSDSSGEKYPAHPLRFIVPFPAGGPGEVLARMIGEKLTASWGQPVEIDIKPGMNGIIGTKIAAQAPADGYTIVFAAPTHYVNPSLYYPLPYDTLADFTAVSLIYAGSIALLAHPSIPVTSIGELVEFVKTHPGKIKFTSGGGYGSPSHLAGVLFNMMAGIDIPYVASDKGHVAAGAAFSEGKEVQLMYDSTLTAMPHIKKGEWRILAVTTNKRVAVIPDTPTIAECGFVGYEVSPAGGVLAPAGTPSPIINQLSAEIAKILHLPDVKAKLQSNGVDPVGNSPQQYAAYVQSQVEKWAHVVKNANLKVQQIVM